MEIKTYVVDAILQNYCRKDNISDSKESVCDYIKHIVNEVDNNPTRMFNFNENSIVKTRIESILNYFLELNNEKNEEVKEIAITNLDKKNVFLENSLQILNKLAEAEETNNKKILNLDRTIKKGSLIQAIIQDDSIIKYVFAKVQHSSYLDEINFDKMSGLPYEKQIFKVCIVEYNESLECISIKILNKNNSMGDYWVKKFLDLHPVTDDIQNTVSSFEFIDSFLKKNIKTQSPADYTVLYNTVISYYNLNKSFNLNEFCKIFDNHESDIFTKGHMERIKSKFSKECRTKFDESFIIEAKSIKNKIPKTYKINDKIKLKISGEINNLKDTIKAIKDDDGKKVLQIKVDSDLYNLFNF